MKLFAGYMVGALLVLGFVLLSWRSLNSIEDMIASGEVVYDLFDTSLEIRRFEKNYLLYETKNDLDELFGYIEKSEGLATRKELELFVPSDVIASLSEAILEYRALLVSRIEGKSKKGKGKWEAKLRAMGQRIVEVSDHISKKRNEVKKQALADAKMHLLVGIAIMVFVGIALWVFFYKKAVMPLSVLEQHMNRISEGEFSLIDAKFNDSELLSLKVAFNRMLMDIESKQGHLVQSEKMASMGSLVFGVAHELNNPLSNIYSSAQILREVIEDEDVEYKNELLDQIESETERARDIVGSVLNYSRSGEKKDTFNLAQAVRDTIKLMKAEIPPGITVKTSIPEDLSIFAFKQKIQQIILNLCNNAIDAIGDEGEIIISAARDDKTVELAVHDNGAGISPDALSKIFDPFYTSKRSSSGYGLGLFVVHNIVEEHGGTISADSNKNVGTVFTITLPNKEI